MLDTRTLNETARSSLGCEIVSAFDDGFSFLCILLTKFKSD